jgi:hypothetical protein
MILLGCSTIALPAVVLPKHLSLRIFQKAAYCAGLLMAYYGFPLVRQRNY